MRNLKKILALVLALVMSLSLMATAGAADFSDADQITDKYADAVTVLNGLEVFKGYDNGATFQPQGDITRAEVAAIIYRIATGDVTDTQKDIYSTWGLFTDVADGSWYAGYVNYCANAGYIKGRGNKIFDPNGKVTGYEALAMILRAIGYDKNNEFYGTNWQVNTASIAKQRGITNNITDTLLGQAATREVVAEILFQAILVPTVTFNTATLSYTNNATSLGKDVLNLDKVTGVVVANEYANVQADDLKVLAEGKTQLRVAAGDVRTLDLGTDLTDIGMAENAYIQGSKVLLISEADNTVFDNTDKNGEHVDIGSASKFSSVSGLSKNDSTEFFVNFDHVTRHEANRRIEVRVTVNDGAEAEFNKYTTVDISKVAAADSEYRVTDANTGAVITKNTDGDDYNVAGHNVSYVRVFRVGDEMTDDDLDVIRGIFGMADDSQATRWGISGSVYVGTNSQVDVSTYTGDKSNEMSYTAFKAEYIDETVDKKWDTSDDGEWVKIIDNNGDGIADYAFRTDFTLDKAVNTYTSGDESTLRYYGIDLIKDDDIEQVAYMNEVAEGDIVLHTVIDTQALIWKADVVEDEVTKISDIYSRKVTATTKSGDVYSQSEIENASRLDQRIDQMDETVNYRMYLDAFGRIRAYEPVDGNRYALITELYYGNLRNGRYVVDDVLTAELKAGDAGLTERVVNNPLNNDFILNFSNNAPNVRDTWSELNTWMNTSKTPTNEYNFYITDLYKDWAEQGFNITRPLAGGVWSDYVVLQPAVAGLGFNTRSYDALGIFKNATTNVARYVINADGTVNLSTAAQRSFNADGTVDSKSYYAVDYVQLSGTSVSSKQNVYTGVNTTANFSSRVDANNETEYYIVSNSGVEHFVGYSNLPAISGIRSMYAVARNTSTDYTKNNYWVAEVIVIEADNYSAQPDDYIFVIGRADMVNANGTLANRQAVGNQYLYAISAKNGVARITTTNLSWGVGTVDPGFYKAYGVSQMENGILTIDRLAKVTPSEVNNYGSASYNTSNFKLRAGTVNRTVNLNDRFGVTMAGMTGLSAERQITLKGPSFALIQDERGSITLSTRLDGDNWTNQVKKDRDILWVEDNSNNALFIIDVTYSESQNKYTNTYNDGIAKLLRNIYNGVSYAQGNGITEGYDVTVVATYKDGAETKKDGVVYLENASGNYLNAANGVSFRVAKGANLLFKVVPDSRYELAKDEGGVVKDIVITINGDDVAGKAKRTIDRETWWELTDIKADVTITVELTEKAGTVKRDVKVQSSNTNDKLGGILSAVDPVLDSSVTITGIPASYTSDVDSVMIGLKKLTKGEDYSYDAATGKITFLKDKSSIAGDIVVVLTITKITQVETDIRIPAVPELTTNARNSRMAATNVPLFFVNNDRSSRNYTLTADGKWFTYSLSAAAVGTTRNISFQYNTDANPAGWGVAVEIGIAGIKETVTLELRAGAASATLSYKVEPIVATEVVTVEPVTESGEPKVTVEGMTVTQNGSVNVYKVTADTQSINVRVTNLAAGSAIRVYAVENDTVVSEFSGNGIGVNGTLTVKNTADANIVVAVTFNNVVTKYNYTVKFVSQSAGTTDPTTPGTGTEGGGTTA